MAKITGMTVLDHGYLTCVESWGSDERIIEAARMSTQKGFEGWGPKCKECGASLLNHEFTDTELKAEQCPGCGIADPEAVSGDEKLLRYLHENKHATPFEFAGLVIEVKAPILVFREWHRHRTQSYNEMSARYAPLPNENYVPSIERLMINSKKNKQAGTVSGAKELSRGGAEYFRALLATEYNNQESLYQSALASGVPKELARCVLPVGRYSKMRASTCLRNWLAFLTLRMDSKAQWEIRQYADAVAHLIADRFPHTWELFSEGMNQ